MEAGLKGFLSALLPDGGNQAVETIRGLGGILGAAGLAAVAYDGYESAAKAMGQARAGDAAGALQTMADFAGRAALGYGGTLIGGALGAQAGSVLGLLAAGPVGAVIGMAAGELVGSLAGGIYGYTDGLEIAKAISQALIDFMQSVGDAIAGLSLDPFGSNGDPGAPSTGGGGLGAAAANMGEGNHEISPLVLDITGTGINLTALSSSAPYFDLTADGFARKTGWIGEGTGLLCLDHNGNGTIDDITELFGSATVDGFTVLRQFDANGDGRLDASDPQFANLRVWVDNGDAASGAGEFYTLAQLGIVSIDLADTAVSQTIAGNTIRQISIFTLADGATHTIADAWFATSATYTRPAAPVTPSAEVADLPQIQGSGVLRDLHSAMMADAQLQSLVESISACNPDGAIVDLVESLMLEWSNSAAISPAGRGGETDARQLAFLEKYTGIAFYDESYVGDSVGQPANPRWHSAIDLREGWNAALDGILARVVLQAGDAVPEFTYNAAFDFVVPTQDFRSSLASLFERLGEVTAQNAGEWEVALRVADAFRLDARIPPATYLAAVAAYGSDSLAAIAGAMIFGVNFSMGDDGTISLDGAAQNSAFYAGGHVRSIDVEGENSANPPALNNTVVFKPGSGELNLKLVDYSSAPHNLLKLGEGINPSAVMVSQDTDRNIYLAIDGSGDRVKLASMGSDVRFGVQVVQFSDGTEWTRGQVVTMANTPTDGDDLIFGGSAHDQIDGGTGNDTLNGGGGNDTYVYGRGDGEDSITETTNNGAADQLLLQGIAPDRVSFQRSGNDVTLAIAESAPGAGDGGAVTLVYGFDDYYAQGVEQVAFDDGTLWLAADLRALHLAQVSTDGADVIAGFNAADTLTGGPGDDALDGGGGNDAYVYARGDGNDTVTETTGNGSADRLVLHGIAPDQVAFQRSGADVVMTVAPSAPDAGDGGTLRLAYGFDDYYSQGIEQIAFDDGTVWTRPVLRTKLMSQAGTAGDDAIAGTSAADVIAGGQGHDSLNGGDGSDVYLYRRGDGQDVITEAMYKGTGDELVLQAVTPDQVSFLRAGNDVTLVIAEAAPGSGDGGSVKLVGGFDDYFEQGVERVSFSDGTSWSRDDLRSRYFAQVSTAGADAITGFKAADTITAGHGNDTVNGNDGDDLFVYARGDGADIITETSYNGSADRVVLHGVAQDALSFERSGNDVTLVIAETAPGAGDGGSVRLVGGFDDSLEQGVEQVAFDDGTVWARPELRAHYFASLATGGADIITGFNTADTLAGGRGNDSLAGAGGNDTYLYTRGDGDDSLTEAANSGTDRLVLHGIAPADVAVQRSGSDVKLVFAESAPGAGDGGTIRLVYGLDELTGRGVEQVALDDGTSWSRADLRSLYFAQSMTPGADTIIGFSSADIIAGGGGADTLTGGSGADLFRYVSVADSAPGAVDIIADFLRNTDHIDLAALDANATAPGDQAFAWIGTAAFSHAAGELRYASTAANIRTVFGDTDGDGVADLQLQLNGSMTLAASDFLL